MAALVTSYIMTGLRLAATLPGNYLEKVSHCALSVREEEHINNKETNELLSFHFSNFLLFNSFHAIQNLRNVWLRLSQCRWGKLEKHGYYLLWRRHENMSPCPGSRVSANYKRIASCSEAWSRNHDTRILETHSATQSGSQHANHSAMTHPWRNGSAPAGRKNTEPTTSSQSERDVSLRGCLHLALTYHFVRRGPDNISPCTDNRVNNNFEWIASCGGA